MAEEINISFYTLIGRLTALASSSFVLGLTIAVAIFSSVHKASRFAKRLIALIGLCNLMGICFSLNCWKTSMYESTLTMTY